MLTRNYLNTSEISNWIRLSQFNGSLIQQQLVHNAISHFTQVFGKTPRISETHQYAPWNELRTTLYLSVFGCDPDTLFDVCDPASIQATADNQRITYSGSYEILRPGVVLRVNLQSTPDADAYATLLTLGKIKSYESSSTYDSIHCTI